ncbi:hypothetical protein D3C81_1531610 [compost metagenome]
MPFQTQAIFVARQGKLVFQRIGIHTDPHGRQFKRIFKNRVPDQNIAVQTGVTQLGSRTPVIIIRRTYVMTMTIAELAADPHQEYRTQIFRDGAFTPFGIKIRITR